MRTEIYKYEDIIHMEHPTSRRHPRMSVLERAAQFSPFAALTGHEAAIQETARLTDRRLELDECEKRVLDEKLQILLEYKGDAPELRIMYFQADDRKEGGAYQTVSGEFEKLDCYEKCMVLKDHTRIPMNEIVEIESSLFCEFSF